MSYIENADAVNKGTKRGLQNEVLIQVQKDFFHEDTSKSINAKAAQSEKLKAMVLDYLSSRGVDVNQNQWANTNKLVLGDLPPMVLHGLTLKAEELGKKITYSQSLTIKISD